MPSKEVESRIQGMYTAPSRAAGVLRLSNMSQRCNEYHIGVRGRAFLMKAPFVGRSKLLLSFVGMLLLIPGDHTPAKSAAAAGVCVDAVDLALDFVPGVCIVKDLLSLGMGVNLITGETMTSMDAAGLIGWLIFPHALRRTRARLGSCATWWARLRRLMRQPST